MEFRDLLTQNLKQFLSDPSLSLEDCTITEIIYNLLTAVKFLHQANIIHRDLKPSNILVDFDLKVQICDFGRSRTLPDDVKKESIY